MDLLSVLIFVGLILCGIIIAAPVAYTLGQRSVLYTLDCQSEDVLNSEFLEVKK